MTILAMPTADLQDKYVLQYHKSPTYTTVSSTYARTGTYSFRNVDQNYGFGPTFPNADEGYCRVCYKLDTSADNVSIFLTQVEYPPNSLTSSSNQLRIAISEAAQTVYLYRSSTLIDTYGGLSFPIKAWNDVQIHWIIDDSTGLCEIKFNGNLIGSFSGDTRNYTGDSVTLLALYAATPCYFDDIIVRTDDWPGRGGLYVIAPSGGTDTEEWTASAGNPEDCVDEIPASFTDYIYADAAVSGVKHLFDMNDAPINATTIGGIAVYYNAKIDTPTDATMRSIIRSGSTFGYGSGVGITVSEGWNKDFYDVNPEDSLPWGSADISALTVGVETM